MKYLEGHCHEERTPNKTELVLLSPQTFLSLCIHWPSVLKASLAWRGTKIRQNSKHSNTQQFKRSHTSLNGLNGHPLNNLRNKDSSIDFSWTCIHPSAGGRRRQPAQWRRESPWGSSLQPGKHWKIRNLANIGRTLAPVLHLNAFKRESRISLPVAPRKELPRSSVWERRTWFNLVELTLIDLYQLFLHTLQSPHWSRFPPVMPFCKSNLNSKPSFKLSASKFICLSASSSHTAEVVWNGPSLKVVKWILQKAVFRFAMRRQEKTLRKKRCLLSFTNAGNSPLLAGSSWYVPSAWSSSNKFSFEANQHL